MAKTAIDLYAVSIFDIRKFALQKALETAVCTFHDAEDKAGVLISAAAEIENYLLYGVDV